MFVSYTIRDMEPRVSEEPELTRMVGGGRV